MAESIFTPDQVRAYFVHRLPNEKIPQRDIAAVRCVFHDDHNPSLSLNLKHGLWKCHSCNEGGGILDFERKVKNCDAETAWKEIGRITGVTPPGNGRRLIATYDYTDVRGVLMYQKLRYDPKQFTQRRPDGNGGWVYSLDGVKKILYRLPEVLTAKVLCLCEGEKDCDNLSAILPKGWAATTNFDGAGKWKPDYSTFFAGKLVVIFPDNDEPGEQHAEQVASEVSKYAQILKVVRLPGLGPKGDVSDWLQAYGNDRDRAWKDLAALAKASPTWSKPPGAPRSTGGPWAPETMEDFLKSEEQEIPWLIPQVVAPGTLTQMFSPRGLGKSVLAAFWATEIARAGKRVLILDRDNPRRELRTRLRNLDAVSIETLNVISREKCPPLTQAEAWAIFPFDQYDLVVMDSLDAMAEGVGEQDSAKPARALAPLLDICHRHDGPAVLLLGNTIRSGLHSRGSGVVEDRADIVYELRDGTDFRPTGAKPWIEELPRQGAAEWAERSARRKARSVYRMAMVATKFRIGEEPAPRMFQVDMSDTPWSVRDVTFEVDAVGEAERLSAVDRKRARHSDGVVKLIAEIERRAANGLPACNKTDAEDFLMGVNFIRKEARAIIADPCIAAVPVSGKGHPMELHVGIKAEAAAEMRGSSEPSNDAAFTQADFRRPHLEHAAEIDPSETSMNTGDLPSPISAADTSLKDGMPPAPVPGNGKKATYGLLFNDQAEMETDTTSEGATDLEVWL
ncbi:MAG TPA: AAA family ATPase [Acidobacteriaceae bacterium]|nr:AAA family ATPase [Acidobacteriaceae bacterium]